jgi:xylulokinase
MTLVNGGAKSPLWRQIIADVTGLSMSYILDAKGAPMGDAMLAGLGVGLISDLSSIEEWIGKKLTITPNPERVALYQRHYEIYKKILAANKSLFMDLSAITETQ